MGVRSDSYKLLPELYSAPAAGYDSARLLMLRVFSALPCWESSKLLIWPESSLGVGVPDTWPTR